MLNYLLNASRPIKRLISLSYDFTAIPIAIFSALALRHGELNPNLSNSLILSAIITTFVTLFVFIQLGQYRAMVRFMTTKAYSSLAIGITISALALTTTSFLLQANLPRSSVIIYWFTAFTLLGVPRLFIRSLVTQMGKSQREPVLIYGAGQQGVSLANALLGSDYFHPFGFIDDDRKKQGMSIRGIKVHTSKDISGLISEQNIKKVLLALGNASTIQRKTLIETLSNLNIEVLTTPAVQDIVSGKAKVEELKEVAIQDLLGREPVPPQKGLIQKCIKGKVVAITGAGGSIGGELCRQVLKQKPKKLILLELNEYSLYTIEQELNQLKFKLSFETEIVSILGSVQTQHRLEAIFSTFRVETIYHAAAYKHVPMVEHNVVEGVRNNVFGTWYCAEAAINSGVKNFVLISTDKAVRPTNVMGASKRVAELVLQALAKRQKDTRFCMVRFGNVLGSSGSVVPLFRKQIKSGGPITVTHPDIVRYFMTIPEAAMLVIQAGSMGKGGDVFVLDMGDPVKITALAQKMIRLSGLIEINETEPNGDIGIQFTGLRPGEKLYEELLIGENVEGTEHPRIMTANEIHLNWPETHNLLCHLDKACYEFKVEEVIKLLLEAPAAFKKQNGNPDWVYNQHLKNGTR